MEVEFSRQKVNKFLDATLTQLASESGIALETWSRWANGKRSPSFDTLVEIAPKMCEGMTVAELAAGIKELRVRHEAQPKSDFRGEKRRKNQPTAA